ncbi:MAG: trypsin-like peptidase domain-containing protein [Armatimonadota bacterium]
MPQAPYNVKKIRDYCMNKCHSLAGVRRWMPIVATLIAFVGPYGGRACYAEGSAAATPAVAATNSEGFQEEVEAAIDKVKPALIRIMVVSAGYEEGRERKTEASGSGIIISPEGYAVTNHHVAGDAKNLRVTLANKEEVDADLVGTDPLADIAVIKLRGTPGQIFPTAQFGDSSKLRVGDRVLAMGSPISLSQSVTTGIVSNTEMIMPEFMWPYNKLELAGEDVGSMVRWIGHDAMIAGGNSGGPLVNLHGEIVGINEIDLALSGAIPSNIARDVAEQIIKSGKVVLNGTTTSACDKPRRQFDTHS